MCASEISPGRGWLPPPSSAALVIVWCGARNGRSLDEPVGAPSAEYTFVVSSASSRLIGGSTVGMRRASIVLPMPGGPESSRLWPPATAISSAGAREALAAHVGHVDDRGRHAASSGAGAAGAGGKLGRPPSAAITSPSVAPRANTSMPSTTSASPAHGCRHEHAAQPAVAGQHRCREHAADRPQRAVEGELAEHDQPGDRVERVEAVADEHADRDRQVERAARLAQVGRREVDRDSS